MSKAKPLKPGPTETQVMTQVLEALVMFGVDVERQNTGGMTGASGRYVAFGKPGNSDLSGMIAAGPGKGKKVDVEVKKPGFNPRRPGNAKARERWAKQVARLRKTNANGGYGFWVTDAGQVAHVLQRINEGWRVVIDDDGFGWVTDEPLTENKS